MKNFKLFNLAILVMFSITLQAQNDQKGSISPELLNQIK